MLLLPLACGLIVVLVFEIGVFFRVKTVNCELEGQNCDTQLTELANSLLGRVIFAHLEVNHPYLSVRLERRWPSTVRVEFEKPQILVTFKSGEHVPGFSLSRSGYLVPFLDASLELPIEDQRLSAALIGQKITDEAMQFYFELVEALKKYNQLEIIGIKVVSEDYIEFRLDFNTTAIAQSQHIGSQLASLQAIWESPTIEHRGKTIDLRFQNPVMK